MSTSFTKKELSEQDLSSISLNKFFPENFAEQLSDKQLQQNLSTDQRQLQNNKLSQNNLQQLSFNQPSFPEKTFNKELATTFAKKSLEEHFALQTFLFESLAFQSPASEQLGREQPLPEAACTEQLYPTRRRKLAKTSFSALTFPETSLHQQPFRNSLVQTSGAKEASHTDLLRREFLPEQLANKNFDPEDLGSNKLANKNFSKTASQEPA